MLSLLGVKKYYDRHLALDIPRFEFGNDIFWTKGANGSGKTTLLRMIAGLLPFEGDIMLNDVSIRRHPVAYRQWISWADAEPLYPAFLTGTELIRFYCSIRKVSDTEASALVSKLQMQHYIDHKTSTYSSGMMKKLSLVLAFLGKARLIILDEPLITLDNDALDTVSRMILGRHSEQGTTFLLSSHMDLDRNLLASAKEISVRDNSIAMG